MYKMYGLSLIDSQNYLIDNTYIKMKSSSDIVKLSIEHY